MPGKRIPFYEPKMVLRPKKPAATADGAPGRYVAEAREEDLKLDDGKRQFPKAPWWRLVGMEAAQSGGASSSAAPAGGATSPAGEAGGATGRPAELRGASCGGASSSAAGAGGATGRAGEPRGASFGGASCGGASGRDAAAGRATGPAGEPCGASFGGASCGGASRSAAAAAVPQEMPGKFDGQPLEDEDEMKWYREKDRAQGVQQPRTPEKKDAAALQGQEAEDECWGDWQPADWQPQPWLPGDWQNYGWWNYGWDESRHGEQDEGEEEPAGAQDGAQAEAAAGSQERHPGPYVASKWKIDGEWTGAFETGSKRQHWAAERGGWRKKRGGARKDEFSAKLHQSHGAWHSWYSRHGQ